MSSRSKRLHSKTKTNSNTNTNININGKFKVSALSAGVAVALGTLSSTPALAQQEGQLVEEIVVTGSHIRRSSFDGAKPIQVVDQEVLARTGATQMVEVLKELTVNSGSQYYNEGNNRAGTSQFNIRNLGLGSTLGLVNGRRAGIAPVADDTGTDFLDINQFPVSMIERIEVLTDGASATYGSQAVAGVSNIITRKGFEGFEISGSFTDAEVVDQREISFAAGSRLEDGRGSFNIYGTWYKQDDAYRSDFDWLNRRLNPTDATSRFLSSTGSPGSYQGAEELPDGTVRNLVYKNGKFDKNEKFDEDGVTDNQMWIPNPSFDKEMPEGPNNLTHIMNTMFDPDMPGADNQRVIVADVISQITPDPDCVEAGGVRRSDTDERCRYQFVDQVSVIAAEERAQIFTEFEWQFSDSVVYYAEASYSNNFIERATGAFTFNTGQAQGGGFHIPSDHPFNFFIVDPEDPFKVNIKYIGPEAWNPMDHTAVDLRATARPLGREINNNELTQFWTRDLNYTRFMNGITWDIDDSWRMDLSYSWAKSLLVENDRHIYRSDVFQDLVREGQWNPFGTRLTDQDLVSPKDKTSTAGNSDDTLALFDTPGANNSRVTEKVTDLILSGDLFELGNGNVVQAAFGGQYRDVSIEVYYDSLTAAGEANDTSLFAPIEGEQTVLAVFGEMVAPLSDGFELQLSVRREDYGDRGDTVDPKVAFEYRPASLDWLGFRASWGTSFQAPTVRQLAAATTSAFIDDPASPTGPGNSLICESSGLNNLIVVAVQGSDDLSPQESENLNFGVIFQFDNGLDTSLDFFSFDYTNLIAQSIGAQAIVNQDCMDDGMPNDPRVVRDAGGQLRQVNTEFVNIGSVQTSGMDLNMRYSMDLGSGTLFLDGAATLVQGFDVDVGDPDKEPFDGAGSRNFNNNFSTLPQLRAHFGGTYRWGAGSNEHSLTAKFRYIDSYTNDQSNNGVVDAWETLDVQYNLLVPGLFGDGDTQFTLGANNVTGEDPPALARYNANGVPLPALNAEAGGLISNGLSDRPGYDSRAGHDIRGTVMYVKMKHNF